MKLTNTMKERIIKSIMAETFGAREKAIATQKKELADAIYEDFYGPHRKKMSALPETFFLQKSAISVKFEGDYHSVGLEMSQARRLGKLHEYSSFRFGAKDAFTETYRRIFKCADQLFKDKAELERTLNSMVLPITTDKRLIEVWPDAEKWIPRTTAAKLNLPAIRPEDLNSLISKMKGDAP